MISRLDVGWRFFHRGHGDSVQGSKRLELVRWWFVDEILATSMWLRSFVINIICADCCHSRTWCKNEVRVKDVGLERVRIPCEEKSRFTCCDPDVVLTTAAPNDLSNTNRDLSSVKCSHCGDVRRESKTSPPFFRQNPAHARRRSQSRGNSRTQKEHSAARFGLGVPFICLQGRDFARQVQRMQSSSGERYVCEQAWKLSLSN